MELNKEKYLEEKYVAVITGGDVKESDEVISLDTLYNSLYSYFYEVYNVYNNILRGIADSINKSDGTYFALNGFSKVDGNKSFKNFGLEYDEENDVLSMYFLSSLCSPIIIRKSVGEDNYRYDSKNRLNDNVLESCNDKIEYSFKTVENSILLFKEHDVFEKLKKGSITQSFKSGDIDCSISYNATGEVGLSVKFNEETDPQGVQFSHFVGEKKHISYLFYNVDVARKKIPINISELDSLSQELISRYRKINQKTYSK